MKALLLFLLLTLATLTHAEESHIVINVFEATPTMESITLEIQSVSQKKSWFVDLDRSPYDNGVVQTTFVAKLPFSGRVKFVWWINSYFDESLKAPRKGIEDKRTYVLKEGAWSELPNVVAEANGDLDPDFLGQPLSTYILSGYKPSTEASMAHLFTYPDHYLGLSLDAKDVVARVPNKEGQSRFSPCLLSVLPGTYGLIHPDSSFSDDPEWLISEAQEYEAGNFYGFYYEDGVLLGTYPVDWVDVRTKR